MGWRRSLVALLFLFALISCACVDSARILLVPVPAKSHLFFWHKFAQTLISRGHYVKIVMSSAMEFEEENLETENLEYFMYKSSVEQIYSETEEFQRYSVECSIGNNCDTAGIVHNSSASMKTECISAVTDKHFMKKLREAQFDIVLVDGLPPFRCVYVIPYKLSVPYATLTFMPEPWLMREPMMSSVLPLKFLPYNDEMSLYQRLVSFSSNVLYALLPPPNDQDDLLPMYADEKPSSTLTELAANSSIWLVLSEFTLDYPRPSLPHIINVGGLSPDPARLLSNDLTGFMDGATDGVIVVSFGSFIKYLPNDINKKLLDVFKKVPQRIVWRYDGKPIAVPDHVRIFKWLPQNDLLGHSKTRLFISHCGNNGQYEALYHGVPMIGMPIRGDQTYNAIRMVSKGFGVQVDIASFKPIDLEKAISILLSNSSYRDNIKKASKIYCSLGNARDRAAFWVEHVVEFGANHLRSKLLDVPLYQYLMLDVLGSLTAGFILELFVIWKVTLFLWKCMREDADTHLNNTVSGGIHVEKTYHRLHTNIYASKKVL